MRIGGETQPGRLSDNAIPLRILPARHRFPKKRSKPLIPLSERRWYILTAAKYQGCTIICNINRYFLSVVFAYTSHASLFPLRGTGNAIAKT